MVKKNCGIIDLQPPGEQRPALELLSVGVIELKFVADGWKPTPGNNLPGADKAVTTREPWASTCGAGGRRRPESAIADKVRITSALGACRRRLYPDGQTNTTCKPVMIGEDRADGVLGGRPRNRSARGVEPVLLAMTNGGPCGERQ